MDWRPLIETYFYDTIKSYIDLGMYFGIKTEEHQELSMKTILKVKYAGFLEITPFQSEDIKNRSTV